MSKPAEGGLNRGCQHIVHFSEKYSPQFLMFHFTSKLHVLRLNVIFMSIPGHYKEYKFRHWGLWLCSLRDQSDYVGGRACLHPPALSSLYWLLVDFLYPPSGRGFCLHGFVQLHNTFESWYVLPQLIYPIPTFVITTSRKPFIFTFTWS